MELLKKITILDGAMGTMMQRRIKNLGSCPESAIFEHPGILKGIYREYIEAGAEIILTNTFGANGHKLAAAPCTVDEVVPAAVALCKEAAAGSGVLTALEIGPVGELLRPMGTLGFEEAYDLFSQQVRLGAEAGADLLYIETMSDLQEARAAVLAAKENSSLPVFCTMTFDRDMRTFSGNDAASVALTLSGLGADAIGINCSLGPREIYPIMAELSRWTSLPLIVKPNAGLPKLSGGETSYDISKEEFAEGMERFVELGVTLFGGCCGTTPEYIRLLSERLRGRACAGRGKRKFFAVCSARRTVEIEGIRVIGERLNPTGKKRLKEALYAGDLDYIVEQGVAQTAAGADILDLNVGIPGIDEAAVLSDAVLNLQSVVDAPLQLDSSSPEAVAAGLRLYCGKAIVNSVSGDEKTQDEIFPLVRKYGAAVVALTLDKSGIPQTAEERLAVAEKIIKRAGEFGIPREDVFVDCLTLTAGAEQKIALETVKAVGLVSGLLGVKTTLGVSNISFGLPAREEINRTFLAMAISAGLDLPIMNPNDRAMSDTVAAARLLKNFDSGGTEFIARFSQTPKNTAPEPEKGEKCLGHAIENGLRAEAAACVAALLQTRAELSVIEGELMPALDLVGRRYESGEIFLPQLMRSAEAAKSAFEVIRESYRQKKIETETRGKIILATVFGDIHDIGKNIVRAVLENYGYSVIDLGRDVPKERVIDAVRKSRARLVGLSALMTTTVESMRDTIAAVKAAEPDCLIMAGGAVLNEEYSAAIGADYYAKDAQQAARIAKRVFGT